MERDGVVELAIDALAAGGDGVGRGPDGRVVFVPFTAPGDRVRVRIRDLRARFARGRVESLLAPGPARVEPVCAVFGSCGGCAWQHVAYAEQLEAKRAILVDALVRLGRLAVPDPVRVHASPAPYRYRGRTRVRIEAGRVGYRRRRSHALCATARCPVLVEPLEERLSALSADPPRSDAEWELAWGASGVRAGPATARAPRVEIAVAGDRIAVSPGVFAQSNALLQEALALAVHAAAGTGARALELFAGAGFLTLGLARRFARVVAVEASARALADLRHNLRTAGLGNVDVRGEPVERALKDAELAATRPEAVVLDPPRTGLPPGAAGELAALGAPRLVYLSCDPATLARDLAALVADGYCLRSVEAFDLFPQTPHVEALAVLVR